MKLLHAPSCLVQDKFSQVRKDLSVALIERDDEIDLCLTALVAREHVLLVGPPGCAKSLLLDSIMAWAGGKKFAMLLTKFSVPEECFGPVSLSTTHSPVPLALGNKLLGEVISWTCSGVTVTHAALLAALKDAGLDEGVARELAPRHAFTRACKKLSDQRIIRQVGEDESSVRFQFTHESRAGDKFEYELETMLTLDKKTGTVACDLPGLATMAQEHLDHAIEARTGSDVTRVIQKLFERHADLFAIRPQGGCYYVAERHTEFVNRVQGFLGRINVQLLRFPIQAGTAEGDRSVKEAVASGLAALIAEHRQAIESFGSDTRDDTLTRAAEKIRKTQFKVQAYAEYLADEKAKLDRELAATRQELRAKVEQLAATPVA